MLGGGGVLGSLLHLCIARRREDEANADPTRGLYHGARRERFSPGSRACDLRHRNCIGATLVEKVLRR